MSEDDALLDPNSDSSPSDGTVSPSQQISTSGGAYISGDVTSGKDAIGRDQIVVDTMNIYPVYLDAPTPIEVGEPGSAHSEALQGRGWTKIGLALGGVALVVSLVLIFNVFLPPAPLCTDARQCVLVSALYPPDDEQVSDVADRVFATEISDRIFAELANGDLLPSDIFNVRQVDFISSGDQVRQLVAKEDPQIVVWGRISKGLEELIVHFEVVNQLGVGQSNQLRPYRVHFFESVAPQLSCAGDCFTSANLRQAINQLGEAVAHMAVGMLHYGLGQGEEADYDFGIALHCIGEPVGTENLNLANVDCSQKLNLESFNTGSLYYYAGRSKLLTGDYVTAQDYLQKAAAESPDDPAPLIGLATVFRSWLDHDNSPEFAEALDGATQRSNALRTGLINRNAPAREIAAVDYELGFIAELQEDWGGAEARYEMAIEGYGAESAESYVSQIALGRVLRKRGMSEAADERLQQAHALDPSVPWALLERAQLYSDDRKTAEPLLKSAREIAPNQPYVDIIEAQICTGWADYVCTEAAYGRAQERRPNSGWLYGRIGDFYHPAGEPLPHQDQARAAEHYAKAVQHRPNDPWAHERLAFAMYDLGKVAEAADHFAVSLQELSHPQSQLPERYCTLAQAQQAAGALNDALENYQICRDKLEDPDMRATVEALIVSIQELEAGGSE